MRGKKRASIYTILNYWVMGFLALICIIPLINVLAISFSSQDQVVKGLVFLTPKGFSLDSYKVILQETAFLKSFVVSVVRVVVGTVLSTVFTVLMAYPLSKSERTLPGRNIIMIIIIFVMLFNAGLVPVYLLIRDLGLLQNYLVLVLPGLLPVFNVIIVMNFMRMLPPSLEEAAIMDGAGFFTILTKIIVPLSKPAIVTISLFTAVAIWNDYFTGLIYLDINKYPLQTYLYAMNVNRDINNLQQALLFQNVGDKTLLSAQMFVALIPVLLVYPFLQKHFVKGIVLGAVKG
ncbi:carbohydrate ABC transporter permease [Candidatus Leptofilum sp.]|uniref:carbohydrate ABC transporter permease n=1 Tax=Candidatus Leptofilum sp. TaxID=3241576 RepID=UPI003B5A9B59